MNLNHSVLVFLIIVWINWSWRTDHLHYFGEFVHLGPVRCIETIWISKIDVCSVGDKKFNDLSKAISGSIVECSKAPFISKCGVGSVVEQKIGDFKIILLHTIMKRSFFANIMILLDEKGCTLRLTSAPYLTNSLTRLMFWIMTAMWTGVHPLTLRAFTSAYLSESFFEYSREDWQHLLHCRVILHGKEDYCQGIPVVGSCSCVIFYYNWKKW